MRVLFLLLFTWGIADAQMMSISSNNAPGRGDDTPPGLTISSTAIDPVIGAGVTISATITATKPVTGLDVTDITTVNCTLSGFAGSGASYSVTVDPTTSGTFSIQILANKCTAAGIDNTASNTLSYTYVDDSGSSYDLEHAAFTISKHYRGHKASFSDTDDGFSTNAPGVEMWGFKYSFGLTAFNNGKDITEENAYDNGVIDFGCYSNSTNYNTLQALMDDVRNGLVPSALSYASGITTYAPSAKAFYLTGRNSVYDTASISYNTGQTDDQLISRALTFRQEYYSAQTTGTPFQLGSEAAGVAILAAVVPRVISKGAWYTNFMHWHRLTAGYGERYFKRMDSLINLAGGDIFYGSYNTVGEYFWAREAVTSVSGSGSTVTLNWAKDYAGSPYNLIQTQIWVYVNLTGTVYAGHGITTSHGGKIRSMGGNVYYISYLLDFSTTSGTFDILTTPSPSYINLTKPVINRTGTAVTVDQTVRMALFRKLKTEPLEMKVTVLQRYLTPGTSFTLPTLNQVTYDYYLGAINAEGISSLIQFCIFLFPIIISRRKLIIRT